jgi:hypothetical protein
VPQIPSARVRTRIAPSDIGGSAMSSSRIESFTPGNTVTARMGRLAMHAATTNKACKQLRNSLVA